MKYTSHFFERNDVRLHCIEYPNNGPALLLMHGLTANSHAFSGLIQANLADHFHVYSIDFRGRGKSDKVAFHYSIREHGEDVIAFLDHFNIERIHLCGHSFGGLLATWLAYHYPERVDKVVILDAAPEMNPKSAEMLVPALGRLDHRFESFEAYLEVIRQAPYLSFWDEAMLPYYQADVETAPDGTVEPIPNLQDIIQVATHVSKENWSMYFTHIPHQVLLVVALDHYTLGMPLLPEHKARDIVSRMKNARLMEIHGNHQTMLFGKYAAELVQWVALYL